jgi:tetratricopeptide (TPR) repeat protein
METDLTAIARRHSSEPPKLIHLIRGDLDWIVMKALEKDRTRRFPTANALADDAERFLKNEPVEARPPSSAYKLQKMLRRNKTAFAAASAVIAALVLGLGLSLYLYTKERTALRMEKDAVRRAQAAERQQALLREQAEKGLAIERRMRELSSVGSKLTEAGFLLSQGLFDKAEEVMKEVPPIIPQSASIYSVLGNQHFRQGELKEAITNFTMSVRVDPTNHFGYHYLAPLLLLAGEREEYLKLREEILRRFGETSDPAVAERMAKDCLILPPAHADLPTLGKMADLAVSAGPSNKDYPYYQFVKGFAEYRQDHPAAAVGWLQSVIAQGGTVERLVEANAVLAMAQFRQQQTNDARVSMDAAKELEATRLDPNRMVNWNDRIIGNELIKEAATLIDSSESTAESK